MVGIGTVIDQRYEIIGNIGAGGMANVYLANDLILHREVAVKLLRFDFQNDQDAIRRFRREALAATELVHPNIVSVYDVGEEDEMQYIVMEYVQGMDLKQYIQLNAPLSLPLVVDIMEQILSAVSKAHQHRIIHRDLKPQNVLIDDEGVVKITDFGIAIALSETSITQTNTLLGSVHYLSPEQARGGMATRQSDIYALGIILYELLVGRVPFEGESAVSIALKHFQEDMPSVRDMYPNVPQSLENVILHATAKEVTDRYVSVDEMKEDLMTTLDESRQNELPYMPTAMLGETRAINPVEQSTGSIEQNQSTTYQDEQITSATESDETKTSKKNRRKWKIGIAILTVILLILAGLAYLGMTHGEVVVPDVSKMTVEEAIIVLEKAELKVNPDTKEIPSEDVKEGLIVKTNPPIDAKVKRDAEIVLYISSGSQKIAINDYTGQQINQAIDDLVSLGFSEDTIRVTKEYSNEQSGTIISQHPKSGTRLQPDKDRVSFTVSKGPETVTLENMTGYSRMRAETYLSSVGLGMIEKNEYSDTVEAGVVLYTVPGAGSSVARGSNVTVVFSAGPDPATQTSESETKEESTTSETEESQSTPPSSNPPANSGDKPANDKNDKDDNKNAKEEKPKDHKYD